MTLMEIIKALQNNREQSQTLLETLSKVQADRVMLLTLLDQVKTEEYNIREGN